MSTLSDAKTLTGDIAQFTPFVLYPPQVDESGIYLGRDVLERPVYLDIEKLPSFHGVILGTTGSGKSTLARHISLEAWRKGIKIWVVDPHGEEEYRRLVLDIMGGTELDLSAEGFNILDHTGWVLDDYAQVLAEITISSFSLPSFLIFEAKRAILEYYETGVAEGWIEPLLSFQGQRSVEELVESPVYVTMRGSGGRLSLQRMRVGALTLLARLDGIMRTRPPSHGVELLVVMDEAHNLFKLHEGSFLSQLYRETRKFGYSILSLVQIPSFLPEDIYALAGYAIYLSGPKEYVEEITRYSYLTRENIEWLLYRVRGNAVLARQGDPRPRNIILDIDPAVIGNVARERSI